jgi:hypothetical protein
MKREVFWNVTPCDIPEGLNCNWKGRRANIYAELKLYVAIYPLKFFRILPRIQNQKRGGGREEICRQC